MIATQRTQSTLAATCLAALLGAAMISGVTAPSAHADSVDNVSVSAPLLGAYGTGCGYKITINATQNSTVAVDDKDAKDPYGPKKTYLGASPVPYNQTVVMNWTPKYTGARLIVVSQVNTKSKKEVKVTVKQGLGTGSLCLGV